MTENDLAKIAVDCIFKVHKTPGPGLLENAYEECLYFELPKTGLRIEKQRPLSLVMRQFALKPVTDWTS